MAIPVAQSSPAWSNVRPAVTPKALLYSVNVPPLSFRMSKLPPSSGDRIRLRLGSSRTFSPSCTPTGDGASRLPVDRCKNWIALPDGELERPIAMAAVLLDGSTRTPQLLQLPPENPVVASEALVSVDVIVVPRMR